MDHYLSDAMAPRRFSLSLMVVFALAALALAVYRHLFRCCVLGQPAGA